MLTVMCKTADLFPEVVAFKYISVLVGTFLAITILAVSGSFNHPYYIQPLNVDSMVQAGSEYAL